MTSPQSSLHQQAAPAAAFPADAPDPAAIRAAINQTRAMLGAITVILWSAFSGAEPGDLVTTDPAVLRRVVDVGRVGRPNRESC